MPGSSTPVSDWQLFDAEVCASLAYADALVTPGVLTETERDSISAALRQIATEYEREALSGDDPFDVIDARLEVLVGSLAGKFQAGRSRSERLLTALRLWLIGQMETLGEQIADIQRALLHQAEGRVGALMPGYSHFQPVQIVSCGHWLLSYFWMLARDQERLTGSIGRTSISPLGSGIMAGTPYRLDRSALAQAIELTDITQNSMDAVSDWDFAAEFLFGCGLISAHLGRLADDLLLYSSPPFGFVSLEAQALTVLTTFRGSVNTVSGQLAGLIAVGDMQDAAKQRALYLTADMLTQLLPELTKAIETLTLHADRMWDALDERVLAADLADYLAARGIPYREAALIVTRILRRAEQSGVSLSDMALPDFQAEASVFDADVYGIFDFSRSAALRSAVGGTAPAAVRAQIRQANTWLIDAGLE